MDDPTTTRTTSPQPTWNDSMSQLDVYADRLRVQMPLAPPALLDAYVRYAPWVAIVLGALGILLAIVAFFLSTAMSGFLLLFGLYAASFGFAAIVGSLGLLISCILAVIGGVQMVQRRALGWWLVAIGLVISVVSSLIHLAIVSLLVGLAVSYIHLQVKPNYR